MNFITPKSSTHAHERMASSHITIEKGFGDKDGLSNEPGADTGAPPMGGNGAMNEEYTNLVKYISTFRDGRRKSTASELGMDEEPKKKPWWKFGGSKKGENGDGTFEVPDDWLDTELKQGLSNAEVENRRKKTGWNELTTERENMCVQHVRFPRMQKC